ncbi:MAG: hypothetical protein HY062_12450 [Bacteroidetes bacterium]|nr:hypothetical protein [Bacteroidota bacterium]
MYSLIQLFVIKSIFNFGDNYSQGSDDSSIGWDILTNCIGAFVGFGLSLLIYAHQIKKEKDKEKAENEQKDKNLLKYYSELIRKNLSVGNRNLTLVEEYIEKQEKDLTNLMVLPRVPSHDFTRLINVDNKGVFEAWINNFKEADSIKQYQKTNSAVDILDGVVNEVHRMHKTVIEHSYKKMLAIKEIIDNLPNKLSVILSELAKELKEERHKNEYYTTLDSFVVVYGKLAQEGADMSRFIDEFVTPLLKDLNAKFPSYPYSMEIMMDCK